MHKFKFFLTTIFTSILLISCNQNDDSSSIYHSDTNFSKNFGSPVSRDFIGQIVDVDKNPIQNATVSIGSKTVQTDVNGVFIINEANVFQKFAHIKVTKAGYIDGSRSMVPTAGKNNVRIMMLSNAPIQTIQSGVESLVTLPNGTQVKFDGAFKNEDGTAYSGDVQVSMFHLKPSDENISSLMPGMLYAQDKNGEEKGLETFGMLNVELRGTGGQKLQIASGHKAEMSVLIDNSQLATAPATIPLWHFDEVNGYWKEEGKATRQGNKYIGKVSHFSWWNCDTFNSVVSLNIKVVNSDGEPLSNVGVGLLRNGNNSDINSTDDYGQISGLIPANETLSLKIFDFCGNIVYTSTIGPFASDTTLPNIVLNNIVQSTIKGNLVKCDNSKVTNGYIVLNNGNQTLISNVTEGDFNFKTLICSTNIDFSLIGYDLENMQTTGDLNYTFSPSVTNVGDIPACNSISEFISYKIGNDPTYWIFNDITGPGSYPLHIYGLETSGEEIVITGEHTDIGVYSPSNTSSQEIRVTLLRNNPYGSANWHALSYLNEPINTDVWLELKINKYGEVGDYIDLTFSGNAFNPMNNTNTPISGVAHVIRDN